MTGRALRVARSAALTVAAAAGVVCVLSVLLGVTLGIRPLVVQSGSMSPTLETGTLAWGKQVPAGDLEVGDVVMVTTADGDRVTHRIIAIDRTTPTTKLTLQGDANRAPDAQAYPVEDAYRVFADLPYGGRVVAWLSGPVGLFVLGMYAMGMLLLALRKRGDDPTPPSPPRGPTDAPRRGKRRGARRRTGAAAGAAALMVVGLAGPTWAAFSDSVTVAGTTVSTGALTTPTLACARNTLPARVTISWTAASSPVAHGYTARIVQNNATLTIASSGTTRSVTINASDYASLFGQTITVEVRGTFATSWTSAAATQAVSVAPAGIDIVCGASSFGPVLTCSVVGANGDWKIKLDWTYGPPDPSTKFVVRSNGLPSAVPGTPVDVAKALRTWTSAGFTDRVGQIWVVAVEGATEVESNRMRYSFGSGAGNGNKHCPSP